MHAPARSGYWATPWMRQARERLQTIERVFDVNRPGADRATLAGIDAAEACLNGSPMDARSLVDLQPWTSSPA